MIRAGSGAAAQHAFVFATPSVEKGVAFQARPTAGGTSTQVLSLAAAPPVFLRITRQGDTINAYARPTRSRSWLHMGTIVLRGLPAAVDVGLAVSSHVDGVLATAQFSSIVIEPMRAWTTTVIGPGTGRSFVNGTFFSAFNTGRDIWGTADDFTFVHTRWQGDGTLTARLNQLSTADAWSKAGLMFRESLDPGSKYAYALSSSSKGSALQYRNLANAAAAQAGAVPGRSAPGEFEPGFWLRITRTGDLFTSFYSTDLVTWTPLGQATIAMPAEIYVGIAVTSHNAGAEAVGQFDDLTLRHDAQVPEPVPAN
jgi:regulation of enolase protein 1 (concanavalin A-like superfamily)